MNTLKLITKLNGVTICRKLFLSGLVIILIGFCMSIQAQDEDASLLPPKLIENPNSTAEHTAVTRKFTGIPSLAIADNGRLW
ncbi:MAG: hypothetical protein IH594_01910, partial [Bacteroidales bacterium]|nr:hypothetical protein [Bacteroidales bacterium]